MHYQMLSPFQQGETCFFLFDSNDSHWNFGGFKSLGVFACEVVGYYSKFDTLVAVAGVSWVLVNNGQICNPHLPMS
jgi:hypothetical protein